jgi:hypothetical protein
MAVSGIKYLRTSDTWEYESQNKSIWLYITTEEWKNDRIIFFSYPYDTLIEDISVSWDTSIIKTNIIQWWVKINTLSWDDSNYGNLLFFYNAIIWDLKVYNFDASLSKDEVEDDKIFIDFSYMNATNSSLNKRLTYFRQTSIIDYD